MIFHCFYLLQATTWHILWSLHMYVRCVHYATWNNYMKNLSDNMELHMS